MKTNNSRFFTTFGEIFGNFDSSSNSKDSFLLLAKVTGFPEDEIPGAITFRIPGVDELNDYSEIAKPKISNSYTKPAIGMYVQLEIIQNQFFYNGIFKYTTTDNADFIDEFLSEKDQRTDIESNADDYESTIDNGGPTEEEGASEFIKHSSDIVSIKEKEGDNIIKGFHNNTLIFSYDDLGNSKTSLVINREDENYDLNTQGIHVLGDYDIDIETDFPDAFSSNTPEEVAGSGILLKADKIRISSDAASIYLSSAVDATIASKNNINLDSQKQLNVNTPKIYLGTEASEALVLGNKYDALLNELVDAIMKMTVGTGVGPSTVPINAPAFAKIKAKIRSTLSTVNFTN